MAAAKKKAVSKAKAKPAKKKIPTIDSIMEQVDMMVTDLCVNGEKQQVAVDLIGKLRGKLYDKMADMQDEIDDAKENEDNDD